MFGYFRPYHANLTQRERQIFNSYYCRVCYCLRIVGGQMARFCTTYDAALYALVLALQTKEPAPPALKCERLGKKNLKEFNDDEIGLKLARLSLISVGEKLRDDRLDKNNFATRTVCLPLSKAIKRARADEPEIAESSFAGTERINELQNSDAPLSEIFAAYGDMAYASFSRFAELTPETEELIRSISEYNFLVDMVVDYDDDYNSGAYNGFKKVGCPTFCDYYNSGYQQFTKIAGEVTDRLMRAVMAVRDDSKVWNTVFKIISHALDNVLPSAILGKDVGFHYFKDLFWRIGENSKLNKDIKRLGLENEKN